MNDTSTENGVSFGDSINLNVEEYSIDDIFSLLDININEDTNYLDLKDVINSKIDRYIIFFRGQQNQNIVDFFEKIRESLFGTLNPDIQNKTEAEDLLIESGSTLDAEKNRGLKTNTTDTTNKELYDSKKGAGNPINRKTITKLLNVDSRFRKNYSTSTSTNYKMDLPYEINNVIEMKLSDLEFPSTYYPFTDEYQNNYMWLKFESGNGALTFVYIYIEPGNYYHTSLIQKIQDDINNMGIDIKITFNLSYENTGGIGVGNGLVSIGVNSESNITSIGDIELNFQGQMLPSTVENYNMTQKFVLDLEEQANIINTYYYGKSVIDYKQRLGWMLGYREEVYNNSTYHLSEGILDILGPKYLYLIVDDFNNSNNKNFFNSSEKTMLNDNILARISIKGYAFSIQSQTDLSIYSEPRYYYGPVNINKLSVKLVDEYGRHVNLNYMDFSFTLSLITIYSQE